MNFIRINNSFINLDAINHMTVDEFRPLGIMNPEIKQPTHLLKVYYKDDTVETFNIYSKATVDSIADAVFEAITSCVDADCEDVNDYIDEDEDGVEWEDEDDWDDD